jgi:hypothetical protein
MQIALLLRLLARLFEVALCLFTGLNVEEPDAYSVMHYLASDAILRACRRVKRNPA